MSIRYDSRWDEAVCHIVSHGVRDGAYGALWDRTVRLHGPYASSADAIRAAVAELERLLTPQTVCE